MARNKKSFLAVILMDMSSKEKVVAVWFSGLGSPEGIAIDWVSRLVFWTDSALKRLEVAKLDGSLRKVLLDKNIQNPRAIAVNPELG